MVSPIRLRGLRNEVFAEALQVLRHPMYASTILLCPPLFYALFLGIYGAEDPVFVTRFAAMCALLGGICASLYGIGQSTAQERADSSLLLKRTTPLPRALPFIAKLIATLLLTLLASLLLLPTGLLMGAVPPFTQVVTAWPALLLGTVAMSGVGLLQGLFLRPQAAATLSQFVFLLLYLSSGAMLPFEVLPAPVVTVAYVLPPYHTFELMLGASSGAQLGHIAALVGFSALTFALAFWLDARQELA